MELEEHVYSDCTIAPADGYFDAAQIYEDMRMADMLECIGLGIHPRHALEESYEVSEEAWTITDKDCRTVASFGVTQSNTTGVGTIWLLGTYRIHNIKRTFIKHSKEWVARLMGDYKALTNIVCESNELSVRWLTWLGAVWSGCGIDNYKQFTIYK
tara:strand:- start:2834 stop:3301 length:468 start_codon:yes stop_codon:yes gene_type:complete